MHIDKFTNVGNLFEVPSLLFDPKVPFKESLRKNETADVVKKALNNLRKPSEGQAGKVKIVRFKSDPQDDRWFAVKRPLHSVRDSDDADQYLKYYYNNLFLSSLIGDHPHFMKVHAVCLKHLRGQAPKPYLIMEYVEGVSLCHISMLSVKEGLDLLTQLKSVVLHLDKIGICPKDANQSNYIVTGEGLLKLVDFDEWTKVEPTRTTVQELYRHFCSFNLCIAEKCQLKTYRLPKVRTGDLCEAMTVLVNYFAEYEQIRNASGDLITSRVKSEIIGVN